MDFTHLIAIVIILSLVYFYLRPKIPPGPFNWPILGYLLSLNPTAPHLTFTELARKYGPVYSLRLGSIFTVVISDAELIKKIFSSNILDDRPKLYLTHGIMNGFGLIGASGDLWRNQRKFALGCLKTLGMVKSSPQIKKIEILIMEQVNDFIEYLISFSDGKGETVIDPSDGLRHNIGTILNFLVFGKSWARDDETWVYLQHLQEEGIKHIGVSGPLNFLPFLRFIPRFRNTIKFLKDGQAMTHKIYQDIIDEQKVILDEMVIDGEEPVLENFTQLFLYEMNKRTKENSSGSKYFNIQQFYHFLADLFGAGLDTTQVTLRWFLIFMAANPEIQARVYNEIVSVLNEKNPTLEDIQNMPFLDACIAETQRLRSVVPLGIPHSNKIPFTLNGYEIPPNSMIVPLQWAIHLDPEKWDAPEEFHPYRFINEEGRCVKPLYFMPFQLGKRMCLGDEFAKMMLFLFSCSILKEFSISPCGEINLEGEHGITLNPRPQKLIFKRRCLM